MNDYDFQQSGDFLDSLFNPNYTSDVCDLPTTDNLVTSTTQPLTTGTTDSSFPNTTTYTAFSNSGLTSTSYYTTPTSEGLQSTEQTDTKPSLSFPPNFYKEINYADDPPCDIKEEVKEEGETEGSNGFEGESGVEQYEEQPDDIDIKINNVVSSFAVKCHINLRKVATEGAHVIYKRENGMVSMKIRKPAVTASIWSSGKITCTGATSEEEAKTAARKCARILQRLGFKVRLSKFRVVNVLGTTAFPWGITINKFSSDHPKNASYEPELHPGVTYRIKDLKATLKIFSTGSITVTAHSVAAVQEAIEHIYPLVQPYKMEREDSRKDNNTDSKLHYLPKNHTRKHALQSAHRSKPPRRRFLQVHDSGSDSDDMDTSEEEYYSSDESFD